jgi:hypothetical protein
VELRAAVWLEGFGQLKNPMTSLGIELVTSWLPKYTIEKTVDKKLG